MTELSLCRCCGGSARYYTKEVVIRDRIGERQGWKCTCYCIYCGTKVSAEDDDPQEAERKAADWWNRGIYDA